MLVKGIKQRFNTDNLGEKKSIMWLISSLSQHFAEENSCNTGVIAVIYFNRIYRKDFSVLCVQ